MPEKRRYKRLPLKLQAKYIYRKGNRENTCTVVDISRGGIKLETDSCRRIRKGTTIFLKIDSPVKSEAVSSLIDISWTKKIQTGDDYKVIAGGQIQDMRIIEYNDTSKLLDYAFDYWWSQDQTESRKNQGRLLLS